MTHYITLHMYVSSLLRCFSDLPYEVCVISTRLAASRASIGYLQRGPVIVNDSLKLNKGTTIISMLYLVNIDYDHNWNMIEGGSLIDPYLISSP